jgi:ribosomal protein S18 acetylase RimI-like enzyme
MQLNVWSPGADQVEAGLDRLYELDQICFHPGIAYTRDELRAFLSHPSAFAALVEDEEGALLGFAIARTVRRRGKGFFHIITIDVLPSARRQGAGTLLMDWMAERARALRLAGLRLEVAVDNADAVSFYTRHGFREIGRIPGYYLGTIDAMVLERELQAG